MDVSVLSEMVQERSEKLGLGLVGVGKQCNALPEILAGIHAAVRRHYTGTKLQPKSDSNSQIMPLILLAIIWEAAILWSA